MADTVNCVFEEGPSHNRRVGKREPVSEDWAMDFEREVLPQVFVETVGVTPLVPLRGNRVTCQRRIAFDLQMQSAQTHVKIFQH